MSGAALAAVQAVSDNDVSPGVLGFVVVAVLGVATWLLIRSMNHQLKKIDLPGEPAGPDAPAGPGGPGEPPSSEDRGSAQG